MDLTFWMLCSSTIQPAVSLLNKLARIPTSRLGALLTLAEEGAPMDFTDKSRPVGEAEESRKASCLAPCHMLIDRDRSAS